MKKILGKIAGILVVLGLIAYFIFLYPLYVSTNEYGEAECSSIAGYTVGC